MVGPSEAVPEVRERPPSTLKNIDSGPLGGSARHPGAPTVNAKRCQRWVPWEVVLKIRERLPSMLKIIDG
jgi:hypothetical protein